MGKRFAVIRWGVIYIKLESRIIPRRCPIPKSIPPPAPVRLTLFDAEDAHRIALDYNGIDRKEIVRIIREFIDDATDAEQPIDEGNLADAIIESLDATASPPHIAPVEDFVSRIAEIYNRARARERNRFEDAHHTRIEK